MLRATCDVRTPPAVMIQEGGMSGAGGEVGETWNDTMRTTKGCSSLHPDRLLPPPSPLDNFTVLSCSRGQHRTGALRVVQARCNTTQQSVEIHRFLPRDFRSENPRKRLMDDIHALKTLKHPHLITVLGTYGDCTDLHCITEDVSKDGRLCDMVSHLRRRRRLLPEQSLWKFFTQFCRGVAYLHHQGRPHGQLTLSHGLVSPNGVVKVALSCHWFGEHEGPGRMGYVSGAHAAPERFLHSNGATCPGDVWALGTVLYELAALRHPFVDPTHAPNLYTIATSIIAGQYPSLPDTAPFSLPLRSLVSACLQVDPLQRPSVHTVLRHAEQRFQQTSECWSTASHARAPPAARQVAKTVMLVKQRLGKQRRVGGKGSTLPMLPTELWFHVLSHLRVGAMDGWVHTMYAPSEEDEGRQGTDSACGLSS
eukprot:m.193677 g.193677  ORF g.193677 m.193677 type:complete len:423 (-) comp18985_c0_seq1:193-1461(-)